MQWRQSFNSKTLSSFLNAISAAQAIPSNGFCLHGQGEQPTMPEQPKVRSRCHGTVLTSTVAGCFSIVSGLCHCGDFSLTGLLTESSVWRGRWRKCMSPKVFSKSVMYCFSPPPAMHCELPRVSRSGPQQKVSLLTWSI